MKEVKIGETLAYYIEKVGNSVVIVVNNIHPFEYPYEFGEVLFEITKPIKKRRIPVYIDFSNLYGYTKIGKLIYLKDINNIDISSEKDISFDNLPANVKSSIKKLERIHI